MNDFAIALIGQGLLFLGLAFLSTRPGRPRTQALEDTFDGLLSLATLSLLIGVWIGVFSR